MADGFHVRVDPLHEAAAAAKKIGGEIADLAGQVSGASDVPPAPAGLDIGPTLRRMVPLWEQHLKHMAKYVTDSGTALRDTADDYHAHDHRSANRFDGIRP